ncbi:MAG: hypothetical protein ABIS14_01465 [Sphingomonas sp.]
MDNVRGFDEERIEADHGDGGTHVEEPGMEIGVDERRMHVRAYNHWVSLLGGRAYPSIKDLDPANIADFGPHSVLLDFSRGIENPAIAFLGRALREECALDSSAAHIADVPPRSLLSRLTDHYLQIIANRAPIGFEAEFVNARGNNTMYRGILMPFSSDEDSIDFIYGVINWKELVDAETQARLDAEIAAAVRAQPKAAAAAPVWADGPGADFSEKDGGDAADHTPATAPVRHASLGDRLTLAQQSAAAVSAADTRSRAALYRALDRAYDFAAAADADPLGYQALLDDANIAIQLRAPMTPVVKLVFGAGHDKTRLTEYAAVLSHARRIGVAAGDLSAYLGDVEGGIKGVVKAERAARAPAAPVKRDPATLLSDRPALAHVTVDTRTSADGYVVLLARAGSAGTLDIVAALDEAALTQRVMRAATA